MTAVTYIVDPPAALPVGSSNPWLATLVSKPQAAELSTTHGVFPLEVSP